MPFNYWQYVCAASMLFTYVRTQVTCHMLLAQHYTQAVAISTIELAQVYLACVLTPGSYDRRSR